MEMDNNSQNSGNFVKKEIMQSESRWKNSSVDVSVYLKILNIFFNEQ